MRVGVGQWVGMNVLRSLSCELFHRTWTARCPSKYLWTTLYIKHAHTCTTAAGHCWPIIWDHIYHSGRASNSPFQLGEHQLQERKNNKWLNFRPEFGSHTAITHRLLPKHQGQLRPWPISILTLISSALCRQDRGIFAKSMCFLTLI